MSGGLLHALLEELHISDDFDVLVGRVARLPASQYPRLLALALLLRHSWCPPPRPGKQNERFRNLLDLVMMEALIAHDYAAHREARELVFGSRSTHAWPPDVDAMPSHWAEPFAQLAGELELPETDIDPALIRGRTPTFGSIYRPDEQGLNLDSGRPESLRTTTHCGRANAADRPPDPRRALDRPFQFQYIWWG